MEKQTLSNKKSVGIITLYYMSNSHGGVLQAYALQKTINSFDYCAEQLSYLKIPDEGVLETMVTKIIQTVRRTVVERHISILIQNFMTFIVCNYYIKNNIKRYTNNFTSFNIKNIPSSQKYSNSNISNASSRYDIFVTGSDQVWNPIWFYKPYFLDFVPDTKPKIAYAASISLSSLTNEQYALMKPLVSRINHISVREKNAIDLLKGMTTQNIEWVLDPTLLLTVSEWNAVSKDHNIKKPFILVYLLGDNKKNRQCAEKFAKEKGFLIVTMPFITTQRIWQLSYGDLHCYGGPDTFISLIRDAEYIITDSFHTVVFSIIFKKRFVVLKRNADTEVGAMNERLYSLFEITGMGQQLVSANMNELKEQIENINYDGVDERIAFWREKSLKWLKAALDDASSNSPQVPMTESS